MRTRTARIKAVRGILRELGLTIPQGSKGVVAHVRTLLDAPEVGPLESIRASLIVACDEIREFEERMRSSERQLEALGRSIPAVAHLRSGLARLVRQQPP